MRKFLQFLCISACLLLLCGCAAEREDAPSLTRFSVSYVGKLDTIVTLTAYCPDATAFSALSREVEDELARLDSLFDAYNPASAVSRVNAGERVESADLAGLLRYCRDKAAVCGGVNVAMGNLLSLWDEARAAEIPPSRASIEAARLHATTDSLVLEGDAVSLADPEAALNLGAVAKGYAAQKLAALLREKGVEAFLLDCGTSTLVCEGQPPDKEAWQIALRNPDASLNLSGGPSPPETLGTLALAGRCMGVSGDYQKYFLYGGAYYPHILSPETGEPARHYRMVCVLTENAADADYYSTALFALPPEESRLAAEEAGIEALWMLPDGTLRQTAGFPPLASP